MNGENRRQDDVLLIALKTKFDDHIERYERDWRLTQEWCVRMDEKINLLVKNDFVGLTEKLNDVIKRLHIHCDFIRDVSPVYKRISKILGGVMLTILTLSAAALVSGFWHHVHWVP